MPKPSRVSVKTPTTYLYCGLTDVSPDEPCFLLSELNVRASHDRQKRRYQMLVLVRDNAEFVPEFVNVRIDMGAAKDFTAPELRVLGGVIDDVTGKVEVLHTVGELRDIADHQRAGLMWQPTVEPTGLIARYRAQQDRDRRRFRGSSQFGPHHIVQRS